MNIPQDLTVLPNRLAELLTGEEIDKIMDSDWFMIERGGKINYQSIFISAAVLEELDGVQDIVAPVLDKGDNLVRVGRATRRWTAWGGFFTA